MLGAVKDGPGGPPPPQSLRRFNIAEGSAFRNKRRRAHYEIALGSAKELRSVVDAAMALGYVAHVSEIGRDDLEHVIAVLINLSQ